MVGVTEYGEGSEVQLRYENGRPVIVASNEAGYNRTYVDLIQLLEWVNKNMPEFKRQWVRLTKEEVVSILEDAALDDRVYVMDMTEAALREKNGG